MKISVIIPAYNDLAGVTTALNSLQAFQSTTVEYLVQDDASPQVAMMACIPPPMALVARNPANLGFAGNCNAGALRATGDVLFFVNQDVYAVDGWSNRWDSALVEAFSDASVGVVGSRLLFPDGRVQNAGGEFDGHRQPYHRCLGWRNPHHPDVSTARNVRWTTGAALAIRRDVFQQVGGFDPVYRGGYFEDVDLCMKAQQAGYSIRYAPDSTLIHAVGSTGGNPHFMANAFRFRERWYHEIKPDVQAVKENWW